MGQMGGIAGSIVTLIPDRWAYLESKEMKEESLYTKGPHGQMP